MPLLDHFHPPLSRLHTWHSFSGMWTVTIARLLNVKTLPAGYRALPFAESIEVDDPPARYIEVMAGEDDSRPVAVIEVVVSRQKGELKRREAFAAKCAEHLRRGRSLVVIDAVTPHTNLPADLFAAVGVESPAGLPDGFSAASYSTYGGQLRTWQHALTVGSTLPTLPLWLGESAVPLDLEASYTTACADLRIRHAG